MSEISEKDYIRLVNGERLKAALQMLNNIIPTPSSKVVSKEKLDAIRRQLSEWIELHE